MSPRTVRLHAMAMAFDVTSDADDEALAAFHRELTRADELFSLFREDTPMARVGAGLMRVSDAPREVAEVLDLCERYRVATGGAFDARRPDGVIDPTGIVKSWATAKATKHLGEAQCWLVSASGDVVAKGSGWRVGIADPGVTSQPRGAPVIDVITLGGAFTAVATSGSAQAGDHIWDPATGRPAGHYVQASVAGDDLVACDAWATALCAGGAPTAEAAVAAGFQVLLVTDAQSGGGYRAFASAGWPRAVGQARGGLAQ